MHLFGDRHGPHLAHFHARREGTQAFLEWEVAQRAGPHLAGPAFRVGVRRRGHRPRPAATRPSLWRGRRTISAEEGLAHNVTYYYTAFASDEHGTWHRQVAAKLAPRDHHRWHHGDGGVGGSTSRQAELLALGLPHVPHYR